MHDISVIGVDYADDEVIFRVSGVGNDYDVVINQNADLFDTVECACDDSLFRGPNVRCKYICHVLIALGADERDVSDPDFEPSQSELNELLVYAPLILQEGARVPQDCDASAE